MEKINQNKKSNVFMVGAVVMACLMLMLVGTSALAAENYNGDEELQKIFEIYNNADLEDGMLLAPNPMADETSSNKTEEEKLQEIFDIYDNADLKDGELLAPAPETSATVNPVVVGSIAVISIVAVATVIIVVKQKRK